MTPRSGSRGWPRSCTAIRGDTGGASRAPPIAAGPPDRSPSRSPRRSAVSEASFRQQVQLDPSTDILVESIWFAPAGGGSLIPREERLAGFETTRPRVPLSTTPAIVEENRRAFVDRRGAIARAHGASLNVAFRSVGTMYGVFVP